MLFFADVEKFYRQCDPGEVSRSWFRPLTSAYIMELRRFWSRSLHLSRGFVEEEREEREREGSFFFFSLSEPKTGLFLVAKTLSAFLLFFFFLFASFFLNGFSKLILIWHFPGKNTSFLVFHLKPPLVLLLYNICILVILLSVEGL